MARVKIIDPKTVTDPATLEMFDWVAKAEGEVPNHFLVEVNYPEYFNQKMKSTQVLWENGELTMDEVQHVGVIVSKANNCEYCTAAFCTILNFALRANDDPRGITDEEVDGLREVGLTDKGIVQLVHVVSDFASYNRINQVLKTDYDYRNLWRQKGFGWVQKEGEAAGDNSADCRKKAS